MLRKSILFACVLSLAAAVAWAGDQKKSEGAAHAGHDMQAMMDGMAKCSVCKHMVPHMAELMPVMTMDVARLNDGVAMIHSVSDPAKVELYHKVGAAMEQAGMASMAMTEAQVKTDLCGMCQEIYAVMKAGAKMSNGQTKTGDVMVITSSDPAVKARIDGLATMCEAFGSM